MEIKSATKKEAGGTIEGSGEIKERREFEPKIMTFITRDRNGWTAKTNLSIDPRVELIHVSYEPRVHGSHPKGMPDFIDDHYRGIHQHLFQATLNKRNKTGGVATREFYLPRDTEVKDSMNLLNIEIGRTEKEISARLRGTPFETFTGDSIQAEPLVSSRTVARKLTRGEDKQDNTYEPEYTLYQVGWYPKGEHVGVDNRLWLSDEMSSKEDVNRLIEQGMPEEAKEKLQVIQDAYQKFLDESGVGQLRKKLHDLRTERAKYNEIQQIRTTIDLYGPSTEENHYYSKLIGPSGDSVLFSRDFAVGDEDALTEAMRRQEEDRLKKVQEEARQAEIDEENERHNRIVLGGSESSSTGSFTTTPVLNRETAMPNSAGVDVRSGSQERRGDIELSPEEFDRIDASLSELELMIAVILQHNGSNAELEKLKNNVSRFPVQSIRSGVEHGFSGEGIVQTIESFKSQIQELLGRKKINEMVPGLRIDIDGKIAELKSVPDLIEKHNEAEMILDDALITKLDLIKKVRERFSHQPTENVKTIIDKIVEEIVEEQE